MGGFLTLIVDHLLSARVTIMQACDMIEESSEFKHLVTLCEEFALPRYYVVDLAGTASHQHCPHSLMHCNGFHRPSYRCATLLHDAQCECLPLFPLAVAIPILF